MDEDEKARWLGRLNMTLLVVSELDIVPDGVREYCKKVSDEFNKEWDKCYEKRD